ncbi:thioredoxin-like protein [Podospora didyma]|uniref:Thioredoxin-like protein n=1 Tax=Podospora didyma TaxID=330526 RepID=A0AAE0TVY0_9PEZI|nr:thioredoxin-like protein [Podospora didyma]
MTRLTINIDIHADTVCPWCYIGKRNLDRAIAQFRTAHPDVDFKLVWRPYLLYPNAEVSGYQKGAGIAAIFGPGARAIFSRLDVAGAEHGIEFRWEGTSGNSRASHRLILLAAERDAAAAAAASSCSLTSSASTTTTSAAKCCSSASTTTKPSSISGSNGTSSATGSRIQNAVIEAIFHGSFTMGEDASSPAFLASVATANGLFLTEAEALGWLSSSSSSPILSEIITTINTTGPDTATAATEKEKAELSSAVAVDAESARARLELGISAVPSYVVQGRYRVGGMQGVDVFLGVFEKLYELRERDRKRGEEEEGVGSTRQEGKRGVASAAVG